jgi:XTP/dITP diphosphohydrolase
MKKRIGFALNTSNKGKLAEFQRLFSKHGETLAATETDLKEIKSDPVTVVVHKASQVGDRVLVDDTSLDVEGAEVGIDVRWLLHHLAEFTGKKAHWRVLLAYKEGEWIFVYEGTVDGTLVPQRGKEGFGFDPVFLPEGAEWTLAQDKPDAVNARAKAVEALFYGEPLAKLPQIVDWQGEWQ